MVNADKGMPTFSNTEETFSSNGDIVMSTDSDSEEELALAGYEPLPLAAPDDPNSESSDSENDSGVDSASQPSDSDLPPINRIENVLIREVWTGPVPAAVDIKMDSDKVNQVKQAMSGFMLPPSSIPEWANNIPEDQWKQHLISRLHDLQKKF